MIDFLNSLKKQINAEIKRFHIDEMENTIESAVSCTIAIDEIRDALMRAERAIYTKLVEANDNDEEVWYLYSVFTYSEEKNIKKAFEQAQKSIDVLKSKSETASAFSKHYIDLAIELGQFELAEAELNRISNILTLTLEQKKYFSKSLQALEGLGFMPKGYSEALDGH